MIVDRDALLVALVLAPATYSRNRFFELYADPGARAVRRRATMIRSVARQIAHASTKGDGRVTSIEPLEGGATAISFEVASMGLKRTTRLAAIELAALRMSLARAGSAPVELAATEEDRTMTESALARLAPRASSPADQRV